MNKAWLRSLTWPAVVTAALLAGCGGTKTAEKQMPVPSSGEQAAARPAQAAAPVPILGEKTEKTDKKPAKKLLLNPFAMPEIPEEFLPPKEEPKLVGQSSDKPAERPRVRLLGFSNVDGFKALVEVKGDVRAVTTGDIVEGIQILSVEPPNVTFQLASARWTTKLFDQPWHNEQTAVASSPGASRAFSSQSRGPAQTSTVAATSRLTAPAGARVPTVPSIFGSGIPKIALPSTSDLPPGMGGGLGAIPGMPSAGADGANGIPGLPGPGGILGAPSAIPGVPYATPGGSAGTPGATSMPSGPIAMPGISGGASGGAGGLPGGLGGLPGGIN